MERYLPTDSAARKKIPLCSGLLDYFPDACAAVAEVSFEGNEKHNPGQPLHHARGKSMDHADCIMRHLTNRGGFDGKVRESAALAWRAMALLQEELEAEFELPLPRGARAAGVELEKPEAPVSSLHKSPPPFKAPHDKTEEWDMQNMKPRVIDESVLDDFDPECIPGN